MLTCCALSACGGGGSGDDRDPQPVLTSITVSPSELTLEALGATSQLQASARDQNGNAISAQFTWSSSDSDIVAVDADGLVTASDNGMATVTLRSGSVSASATVTVEQKPASIMLSQDEVVLTALGANQELEASVFDANENAMSAESTWASSDPAVAAVDETGRITAQANGTATVTASVGSISDSVTVTVMQVLARLTLVPEAVTLSVIGESVQLQVMVVDANGVPMTVDVSLSSSDPAVASVNVAGLVTAQGNGIATITATVRDAGGSVTNIVAITVEVFTPRKEPLTVRGDPNVRDPRNGRTLLHVAAMANAPRLIEALVEAGALIEAGDHDSNTALHYSAAANGVAAIGALLEAGADLEARNRFGETPLQFAAYGSPGVPEAISMLLDAGADPNVREYTAGARTPLHRAAWGAGLSQRGSLTTNMAVLALLLEAGADPNIRDDEGRPPLRPWVALGENQAILEALLEAGADLQTIDNEGEPLLHFAAKRDRPATVTALLEVGADLNARDSSGRTALHAAAAAAEVYLPVSAAAALAVLLEAGADPNTRDNSGNTALQLVPAVSRGVVTALLDAHAGRIVHNPNAREEFGYTALHAAARANSPRLIAALLEAGADLEALNSGLDTAFEVALNSGDMAVIAVLAEAVASREAGDYRDIAELMAVVVSDPAALAETGLDPNVRDPIGRTALYWAAGWEESVGLAAIEALVNAGADVDLPTKKLETPLYRAAYRGNMAAIAALSEAGADVSVPSRSGTALHIAVIRGDVVTVSALVAEGVDLEARDYHGWTALQLAAHRGNPVMIAALVEAGADVGARDSRGRTALQLAASRDVPGRKATEDSTPAAVAALLEAGANLDAPDSDGRTPLHAAASVGNQSAVGVLQALGANWTSDANADPVPLNARFVSMELFQGPMVWQWQASESDASSAEPSEREAIGADHAKTLLHRAMAVAVRIGSETDDPMPELSVSLSDAGGRSWVEQAVLVRGPYIDTLNSESGLWETEYVYELPDEWVDSGYRATLMIDPYNRLDETDENDNTATLTMDGYAVPVFDVTFVPILFSGDPPTVDTDKYMAVIGDLVPIAEYRARVRQPLDLTSRNLSIANIQSSKSTALTELLRLWNAEAGENEYFHGLIFDSAAGLGYGGQAFQSGRVAVSDARGGTTPAHALGHNLDLPHAPGNCHEEPPIDCDFPYANATIGPRRGWATSLDEFINPGGANPYHDVMTYCGKVFVSDYNYDKMADFRLDDDEVPTDAPTRIGPRLEIGPDTAGTQSSSIPGAPAIAYAPTPGAFSPAGASSGGVVVADTADEIGPSLAFTGGVDEYGLWSIGQLDASTQPPRSPITAGEYFFTLQDAFQREVYREPMTLLTTAHGEASRSWAVRVPVPEDTPAFLAILDAQGTPLFIEPIAVPPVAFLEN